MNNEVLKLASLLAKNIDYKEGIFYRDIDNTTIFISDIYGREYNGNTNIAQYIGEYSIENKSIKLTFINRGVIMYINTSDVNKIKDENIDLFIEDGVYTQYIHERLKSYLIFKSEVEYVHNRIMYILKGFVNYGIYPIKYVELTDSMSGNVFQIPLDFISWDNKSPQELYNHINSMIELPIQNIRNYEDMELLDGSMKIISIGNSCLMVFHTFEKNDTIYKISYNLKYKIGIGLDFEVITLGIVLNGYLMNYINNPEVTDYNKATVMKEFGKDLKKIDKLPYKSLKDYFKEYKDEFIKISINYNIKEPIIFGNDLNIFTAKNGFTRVHEKSFVVKLLDI